MPTQPSSHRAAPRKARRAVPALVIGLAAISALAACSTAANSASSTNSASAVGSTAAPGVTATTITVGLMTDLSGPYLALGETLTEGEKLYFDQLNANGGVCGRKIVLDIQDDGYNVQTAVSLYSTMASKVLAMPELVGSPEVTALQQQLAADDMFTIPPSWDSFQLNNPDVMTIGATYDVQAINSISWLMKTKGLKAGDAIGHIYTQGDYGQNALAGSTYAAGKLGLKLVTAEITPTATDLSSQIATMQAAGVKAILISAAPGQVASAAGDDVASGLNVPLVGDAPTYVPQLLATPARAALEKFFYIDLPVETLNFNSPGEVASIKGFTKDYPKALPNTGIPFGWASAAAFTAVVKNACAADELTRAGVLAAYHRTKGVNTDGILPPLDFSAAGEPSTRATIIAKVDASVPGGLTTVQPFETSALAKTYPMPEGGA